MLFTHSLVLRYNLNLDVSSIYARFFPSPNMVLTCFTRQFSRYYYVLQGRMQRSHPSETTRQGCRWREKGWIRVIVCVSGKILLFSASAGSFNSVLFRPIFSHIRENFLISLQW